MSKAPFGFEKAEESPGFLLWQTTTIWQRQIKKTLEKYNISHAQFVIMANLMWLKIQKQDVTQIKIVNLSKLDKMTVSKSLKKLSTLGYVERIEHKIDARAKEVCLTSKGETLINILVPIVENTDSLFFSGISKLEEKNFIEILRKLIKKSSQE